MNAKALTKKLDKVFNKFQVTNRAVYKRLLSRGGGDPITGAPGTITKTDTKLEPQPVVSYSPVTQADMILVQSAFNPLTDRILYLSPNSISESELRNSNCLIVFKDGSSEEECVVVNVVPSVISGANVMLSALIRSRKR
jgi:hypothetical protein